MAWKPYYTLEQAAKLLSKEFSDTYEIHDLIDYVELNMVDLYANVIGQQLFFIRSNKTPDDITEIAYEDIQTVDFVPVLDGDVDMIMEYSYAKIGYIEKMAKLDRLKGRVNKFPTDEELDELGGIVYYPILANRYDYYRNLSDLSLLVTYDNYFQVKKEDLVILESDLKKLQKKIENRINTSKKDLKQQKIEELENKIRRLKNDNQSQSKQAESIANLKKRLSELEDENKHLKNTTSPQLQRAENKQIEIIAALACIYTKTDCSKPYEAAETIRQQWQRQANELGDPAGNDTIAKYIRLGIERLKNKI